MKPTPLCVLYHDHNESKGWRQYRIKKHNHLTTTDCHIRNIRGIDDERYIIWLYDTAWSLITPFRICKIHHCLRNNQSAYLCSLLPISYLHSRKDHALRHHIRTLVNDTCMINKKSTVAHYSCQPETESSWAYTYYIFIVS